MADLAVTEQDGNAYLSQSIAEPTGEGSAYGRLVPNPRPEDPTNPSSAEDPDQCLAPTFADFRRERPSVRTLPRGEKFRIAKTIRERRPEGYTNGKGKADLARSKAIPKDVEVRPANNFTEWVLPYAPLAPSEPSTAVMNAPFSFWTEEPVNMPATVNSAPCGPCASFHTSCVPAFSDFEPCRGQAAVPVAQQPMTPAFPPEAAAESAGIETSSMDDPPNEKFLTWAGKQPELEGSPTQISIWSHCIEKPEATIKRWYQQCKSQEAPVTMEEPYTSPTTLEIAGEPRPSRVKCIDKQRLRGRYIDSADSAARGPYSCTSGCGMNFARKADWRRHEDNNFPIEEWTCMNCRQSFARQDKLTSHVRTVHKDEGFTASDVNCQLFPDNHHRQCRVCGITFPKVKDFYAHVLSSLHFRPSLSNGTPVEQGQDPITTGMGVGIELMPLPQQLVQYSSSEAPVGDDPSYFPNWDFEDVDIYQPPL